ncbi:MAG TPA: DUF6599 family protein, partial [Candidatus Angelobacter sp.]|nr:DUF6599 family protein [Candidatus Angelobacter sp.]
MKKTVSIFALLLFLLPLAWGKDDPILPQSFHGWQKAAASKITTEAGNESPTDSDVLQEYGFSYMELATYTRDGRTMLVKALRFPDAGGAYGSFTYFTGPEMQTEKIGDQAASDNKRILFYRGSIFVDATLGQVTAMSAGDLRALADTLPKPRADIFALLPLAGDLPQQSLIPNSAHYVAGPITLERLRIPVPATLVDFTKGAEIADAKYRSSLGEARLTLVGYPTPQIATERLRAFQAATLPGGPFYFKRTGPIVALVNGQVSASEAESLLASVNYDAQVTMNQPTKQKPRYSPAGFIAAL